MKLKFQLHFKLHLNFSYFIDKIIAAWMSLVTHWSCVENRIYTKPSSVVKILHLTQKLKLFTSKSLKYCWSLSVRRRGNAVMKIPVSKNLQCPALCYFICLFTTIIVQRCLLPNVVLYLIIYLIPLPDAY